MVEQANVINFTFLAAEKPSYSYTIMILLNRPIILSQFTQLRKISNYVICADGAANRLYELKERDSKEFIPDCIVGDFDSIHQDVRTFYEKKNVNMVIKKDIENTDLDKCLYISLEKLANVEEDVYATSNSKKFCFIILGSSGGRIDHTISTYHHVYKYLTYYSEQLSETEVFMISKCSMSVFLKNGSNIIDSTDKIQNKAFGYSIIPIYGESNVKVYDNIENNKDCKEMNIKFGENVYFYKKSLANKIKINVESEKCALLYTTTTLYFDKFA